MKTTLNDLENIRLSLYNCDDDEEKSSTYKIYLLSLRKLAYRGNVDAQYDLAQHYEDMGVMGWPNPFHSIPKKFYWYSKAAKQGHPESLNNLANMYIEGEGCTQNIKKAIELLEKAIKSDISYMKRNYKLLLKQIKMGKYKIE